MSNISYIPYNDVSEGCEWLSKNIENARVYAGIERSDLNNNNVCIGKEYLGEKKDFLIIAMVIMSRGVLYRFNHHPARKDLTMVTHYKVDSEQKINLKDEVDESLKALRHLHVSYQ